MSIIQVQHLYKTFGTGESAVHALEDINLDIQEGEIFGIIGLSGAGKSTLVRCMNLLERPTSGSVTVDGKEMTALSEKDLRLARRKITMIFQSFNLLMQRTCLKNVCFPMEISGVPAARARERALELLELCGIPDPKQRFKEYPHQLSGGMRQRIMIAIALACDPDLLIADEPTTALDVTIQAQILRLMRDLRREKHMSVMMITHDLGVVSEFCDRVVVVYTGEAVEMASVAQLFRNPLHPYTQGLLRAIPRLGQPGGRLEAIDGMVPDLSDMPRGCHFHPRCPYATERCRNEHPPLRQLPDGRCVRCFLAEEGEGA